MQEAWQGVQRGPLGEVRGWGQEAPELVVLIAEGTAETRDIRHS